MIRILQKTVKDRELRELNDFRVGSWVYVENPSEDEMDFLVKKLSLEKSLLRDALDPYEAPRLEIMDNNVYIFTRTPHQADNGEVETTSLLIILSEHFLITISRCRLEIFRQFLENRKDFFTTQKIKFLLQIFSEINAYYNLFLMDINKKVRATTVHLEKIENKDIVRFVAFESILNEFINSLVPTNTMLKNLLSGNFIVLYKEDEELVEDLLLSNEQLIELCKTTLKTIVNIREAYSTIMTNNLNKIIKFLTALTIILAVPTMIASFYGMNVKLPFADSPIAFIGITLTTLAISLSLLGIFIKKDWL